MLKRALTTSKRKAVALIIVLWTVVLLSIILTNFAFLVRTHIRIATNYQDASLLSSIASGGVERAIAEIKFDKVAPDTLIEHWSNDEAEFREKELGDGTFTLLRFADEGENVRAYYGAEDEASKINIRTAPREVLVALGFTAEQTSAILDWQDEDDTPQDQGAEIGYYSALEEPHPCKNAPLETLQELMQLRGFDPTVLYGEDMNQNGIMDPNENDGEDTMPPDNRDGILDRGLVPYITLYTSDKEVTATDATRVDISSADEAKLKASIPGLTDDEAKAIVKHREKNKFENIGQLLKVKEAPKEDTPAGDAGKPGDQKPPQGNQPQEGAEKEGEKKNEENKPVDNANANAQGQEGKQMFPPARLKQVIDFCKIAEGETAAGRVNINTASARVLRAIPGFTKESAEAVVQARDKQKKTFNNIADLFDVGGMNEDAFIKASQYLTVRSYQFRVRSEARIENVKSTKTIVAVLDRSGTGITIRYWNEQ